MGHSNTHTLSTQHSGLRTPPQHSPGCERYAEDKYRQEELNNDK
ncbi:hypothetical protein [Microcoleus sp. FACHB-68]|nr:hypothetical protein [Microcoleus sp. FACHB-68]